jgi:hypothetical protein
MVMVVLEPITSVSEVEEAVPISLALSVVVLVLSLDSMSESVVLELFISALSEAPLLVFVSLVLFVSVVLFVVPVPEVPVVESSVVLLSEVVPSVVVPVLEVV